MALLPMAVYRLSRLRMECYNSIVMYSGKKVMPFSAFKSFVSKVYHENKIIKSMILHENKIIASILYHENKILFENLKITVPAAHLYRL